MEKIFFIFLFILIFLPFFHSQAAGLVPCGTETYPQGTVINGVDVSGQISNPCQFCDFFTMINNIIREIFTWVIPTVAVLMLIIGGVLFLFAGAKPDALNQAKGILTSVVIGLLIIFAAWVIVNTVLTKAGIVNSPSLLKWYEISCQ